MTGFSYLTFDCYGTLIDWRKGLESNLGTLLRGKGLGNGVSVYPLYVKLEAEQEGVYKSYGDVLRDTAATVARQFEITLTNEETKRFAESISCWPPFNDTIEVLSALGHRGYKRVILSNVDRDLLQETINRNQLPVDGYITAEDVGSYKPAPGHWNSFFKEYAASREETLHVAQSIYHDILPATKLGISSAWINRYGEQKPGGIAPQYEFKDLRGLMAAME